MIVAAAQCEFDFTRPPPNPARCADCGAPMLMAMIGPGTGALCPDCYGVERSAAVALDAVERFRDRADPSVSVERVVRAEVGWWGETIAKRLAATPARLTDEQKRITTGRIGEGVFDAYVLSRGSFVFKPVPALGAEPPVDSFVLRRVAVPGERMYVPAQVKTYAATMRGQTGINLPQWRRYLAIDGDIWVTFVDRRLGIMYGGFTRRMSVVSESGGKAWFDVRSLKEMAALDSGVIHALNELTTSRFTAAQRCA